MVHAGMLHAVLNVNLLDINKLSLLRTLESGQYLSMDFHSWNLYEFLLLQSTTKHLWAVKTATQLEKLRYVIFALQTVQKNILSEDAFKFDDCRFINMKLYLNSDFYPYDNIIWILKIVNSLYYTKCTRDFGKHITDVSVTKHSKHEQISNFQSDRSYRLLPSERISKERQCGCLYRI